MKSTTENDYRTFLLSHLTLGQKQILAAIEGQPISALEPVEGVPDGYMRITDAIRVLGFHTAADIQRIRTTLNRLSKAGTVTVIRTNARCAWVNIEEVKQVIGGAA